tara:strand:+ start:692 stop:1969 length:1278 start_codon:yes stop_codon:yes gene_type:complete
METLKRPPPGEPGGGAAKRLTLSSEFVEEKKEEEEPIRYAAVYFPGVIDLREERTKAEWNGLLERQYRFDGTDPPVGLHFRTRKHYDDGLKKFGYTKNIVYRVLKKPDRLIDTTQENMIGEGKYNVVFQSREREDRVYRVLKYGQSYYTADEDNATLQTLLESPPQVRALFPEHFSLYTAHAFTENEKSKDKRHKPIWVWLQTMTKLHPIDKITSTRMHTYVPRFLKKFVPAFEKGLIAPDLKMAQLCVNAQNEVFITDTGACFWKEANRNLDTLPCTFPAGDGLHLLDVESLYEQKRLGTANPEWLSWLKYSTVFAACCTVLQLAYADHQAASFLDFIAVRANRLLLKNPAFQKYSYGYDKNAGRKFQLKQRLRGAVNDGRLTVDDYKQLDNLLREAFEPLREWAAKNPDILASFVDFCSAEPM